MNDMGFSPPDPYTFMYGQQYNPGASMGFNPGGLGGIMAPLATQYLMQFAGPTNFLPHQNPAQAITDQLAMRQYFNTTQANTFSAARAGTGRLAAMIGGGMSALTGEPLTDLNRQQASQMAAMANNPYVKPFLAAAVGPENLEAMMFGTRGDPSALAAATNRVGYYRRDPDSGATRMDAESLEDFTRSVYSSLYEPDGNIEEMASGARAGKKEHESQLKRAAKAEHERIVADSDIATRMADLGAEEVNRIYKKYKPGGEAVTVAEQAQELTKFDRAVRESGVLKSDEASVAGLQRRAEQAAVQNAHGFSAGQAGQVMENLFQRGMLPQSIGALSAADRVKLISQQELDQPTLSRLAKQFGHRELMETNSEYQAAVKNGNQAKQDDILEKKMSDYERRVGASMQKIKDTQRAGGPQSAEHAERLLSMDGMDSVASNIDAGRASGVVKKHTEALAAIRQIFGDNGNPNAPVPALLAALDELSNGAASRMTDSSRVASTLREMRGMAHEMGMGLPELLNVSRGVNAYGRQLGLAGEVTTEATANTLAMMTRMREQGAFDANRGFGSLNQGEMRQRAATMATRTEGSVIAKGSAAMRRAYAQNKEKYEGTELGEIAKRMEDPNWDGSYEWKGKKRNFYQEAGQDKMAALSRIATESNMTPTQLQTLMLDHQTQEYQTNADGLKAARYEFIDKISNATVAGGIRRAVGGTGSVLDQQTEQAINARAAVGRRMTEMMLEVSDQGSESEQLDYLEKNMEAGIAKTLEDQGYSADQAKAEATRIMEGMFGADPVERRAQIQQYMAEANVQTERESQGEYRSLKAIKPMLEAAGNIGNDRREQKRAADQAHKAGQFYQGTPMGRASDYLAEIGMSGEAFNFGEFLKETFGITANDEMRDRLAPELQGAFARAQEQISSSTVTDKYLRDLAAGTAVDYEGKAIKGDRAKAELKKLATRGMSDEERATFNKNFKTEVSDATLAERRKTKLDEMGGEAVSKLYKETFGGSGTDTETDVAKQRQALLEHKGAVQGLGARDLLQEGEYTQSQLVLEARQRSGGLARDEGFADEHERRRKQGRARFTGLFGRTEEEVRTGLKAALYGDAQAGGYSISDENMTKFMELGMYADGDDDGRKKFEKAVKNSGLSEEQQKQVLQTFNDFRTARDEKIGDKLDPESSSAQDAPVSDPRGSGAKPAADGSGKPAAEGDGKRADAPAAEIVKLSEVIKSLEKPFRDLIDAISKRSDEKTDAPKEDSSDADGSEARQAAHAASASQQAAAANRTSGGASSGGGSSSGGSTIRGTLTLIGLQEAMLAARGSPVFTPSGGGPSIVPGNPGGPDFGASAVAPVG